MRLSACEPRKPAFIKPFRWAPTRLSYLRICIAPKISQLNAEKCYLLEKTIIDCHKHGRFVSRFYTQLQALKKENGEFQINLEHNA